MNNIQICYPGFKRKCFTLSYDDGVLQDIPFLEMINFYGVKATFNLNSGLFGQIKYRNGINNSRLKEEELLNIYEGHEIASHSMYHYHLENKDYETNYVQIKKDKEILESMFNTDVKGFAYPFGTYSTDTIEVLKKLGFVYARTTKPSYKFTLDEDYLLLKPTCSHSDKKLISLALEFIDSKEKLALFYVWGHTYEFANNDNWGLFRELLEILKNDKDIAYLTNIEAITYLIESKKIDITNTTIFNNSYIDLFFIVNNEEIIVKAKDKYVYMEEEE